MSDLIASIFMGAVKEAGSIKVSEILAKIKEHNTPEVYENALKSGNSFFNLLNELAVKTKSKIDDNVIAMFQEPIQAAADEDDIDL